MTEQESLVDIAISYAGEDAQVASELSRTLRELRFSCFMAGEQVHLLAGVDAERFFEQLFTDAKVVVALISSHYRNKEWTRYEWDIIRDRPVADRYVPVKLDPSVRILGLPSNVIYHTLDDGLEPIIRTCLSRVLRWEQERGIRRTSEFAEILRAMKEDSQGSLAQAYQLVKDGRSRDPLDDALLPQSLFAARYKVVSSSWSNFSVVRRLVLKITLPPDLSPNELMWNLKHCCATYFNAHKPDALMVFGYWKGPRAGSDLEVPFTAARAVFAPFGRWDKAQDGVAYNIPTSEFRYEIDLAPRQGSGH